MKKIIAILFCFGAFTSSAQTFPSTDSLKNFIDKHIRNSAINAFTNLRLNTALKGIINMSGGTTVDTVVLKARIDSIVVALSSKVEETNLADVAFTGDYSDLSNPPAIPTEFDTTGKFGSYQTAINNRIKYTDSSNILADYRTALLARVRYADTANILSAYQSALNTRLTSSDIANMAVNNVNNNFSTDQTVTGEIRQIFNGPMVVQQATAFQTIGHSYRLQNGTTEVGFFSVNTNSGEVKIGSGAGGFFTDLWSNNIRTIRLSSSGMVQFPLYAAGFGKFDASGNITSSAIAQSDITKLQDTLNTREYVANKSTSTSLGTSNTLYPSQNAVKAYVDAAVTAALAGSSRRVLYKTTQGNLTGTTAETELYRDTIKAAVNPLGLNSSLQFIFLMGSNGSAGNRTLNLKINGTTVATRQFASANAARSERFYFIITNRNSMTSQVQGGSQTNGSPNLGFTGTSTNPVGTQSFNFANDIIVTVTGTLTNGADAVSMEDFGVWLHP